MLFDIRVLRYLSATNAIMKRWTLLVTVLLFSNVGFGQTTGLPVGNVDNDAIDSSDTRRISLSQTQADTSDYCHFYVQPLDLINSKLSSIDLGLEHTVTKAVALGIAASYKSPLNGYSIMTYGDIYWSGSVFRSSFVSALSLNLISENRRYPYYRPSESFSATTLGLGTMIGYKHHYRGVNTGGASFGIMLGGEFYRLGISDANDTGYHPTLAIRISVGYVFCL